MPDYVSLSGSPHLRQERRPKADTLPFVVTRRTRELPLRQLVEAGEHNLQPSPGLSEDDIRGTAGQ